MAEQFHEGRAVLIERISTQLNMFLSSIETAIRNNLPNRNVLAETTLMGLLNLIHDWDLVNANSIRQNFPGIDLIDPDRKIGIQVTSTNTLKKVDNTLEKVANLPDDMQIDHLHIMVITSDPPSSTMKGRTQAPYFSGSDDIWNIATLLRQIMDLPVSKLERICAYLDAELGTLREKMAQKCLNLPLSSALDKDSFVGREKELEEIARKLHSKAKPIVLSGLGGMGKTELAVRFGLNYEDGNVYFVRFSESFTATVTAMFRGVCPQPQDPPPEAEQYQTVMALLAKCSEKDILIIDNVDADSGTLRDLMKDEAYKALKAMKLRLILTTRFDEDRAVGIRPMPNETLYEIFEKHGVSLEESKMDELIEAVNGHTLTIDLMARTLNGKGWRKVTAEMLLDAIRKNTLPGENYRKIATDYNQSEDQAQIYQHLSVVFDAKSVPEDAQNILRWATLLPADGMNGEYFANPMTDEGQAMLDTLIDHGWLTAEDGLLSIHPVIRLVCREELKPSDENCEEFLTAQQEQYDAREFEWEKLMQMAQMFEIAADILEDSQLEWFNTSSYLFLTLGMNWKTIVLYNKHIPALERQEPNHPAFSTAYQNVGYAYSQLDQSSTALEYQLKSLTILESTLSADDLRIAIACSNIGTTYSEQDDHEKALEFKLRALELLKDKTENPLYLATAYNNIGLTYCDLGNTEKAMDFHLKSLEIREKVLPSNHPRLAATYVNIASVYRNLRDFNKALEYHTKAVKIREQSLPSCHPDLASSYLFLGETLCEMLDYDDALCYMQKAIMIFEQILPEDHPKLAEICNNMSFCYFRLGCYEKALRYLEAALSIYENAFPADHPRITSAKSGISVIMQAIAQNEAEPTTP